MVIPSLRRAVREPRERRRWGPHSEWIAPKNNESIFARCPQISRWTRRTRLGHREGERKRVKGRVCVCVYNTKNQLVYYIGTRFFLSFSGDSGDPCWLCSRAMELRLISRAINMSRKDLQRNIVVSVADDAFADVDATRRAGTAVNTPRHAGGLRQGSSYCDTAPRRGGGGFALQGLRGAARIFARARAVFQPSLMFPRVKFYLPPPPPPPPPWRRDSPHLRANSWRATDILSLVRYKRFSKAR